VVKRVSIRRFDDFWTAKAEFRKIGPRQGPPDLLLPKEIQALLKNDLSHAEARARSVLESRPRDADARFLLGACLRGQKRYGEAREVLAELTRSHPEMGSAWRELGLALEKLGHRKDAIDAFLQAIDEHPVEFAAWRGLGTLLFPAEEKDERGDDSRLIEARSAFHEERYGDAESILRPLTENEPANAHAHKLLGDVLVYSERWEEAKPLFQRAVALTPDSISSRFRLASMLLVNSRYDVAWREIRNLLAREPGNALYRHMEAVAFGGGREFERAIPIFQQLLSEFPDRRGLWLQYALMIRSARPDEAFSLYEEILRRFPDCVEIYYSFATLKSFRFDASWPPHIQAALARLDLPSERRIQLHFVLGKAYEDLKEHEKSFEHYKASNNLLFENGRPDNETPTQLKWRLKWTLTPALFRARQGSGCDESGAIFILGMPRSGSTLLEQILFSHSAIEGLEELEDLPKLIDEELERDAHGRPGAYPGNVPALDAGRLRLLGEAYMAKTRRRRKTDRSFFTDKAPINWRHIGLIHLILPNAKIIDARRHPLDCCFSCYKHYFPSGQPQTWNLGTVGRFYVDYVELMAHWDRVLPGRVHRVIYENMVNNQEEEVRRLLDYLGLPFEEQCLRFHESKRYVRTISSEQVRMPLYKSGMGQWKPYEAWLGPLKEALGGVLDYYPDVPEFFPRLRSEARPYPFGKVHEFGMVKGVRQPCFETSVRSG
jgi:tetratricopeptide (TPR) repeat protein